EKPQLTRALVADQLVHLGRLGLKSAKGWYDYDAQLMAQPSAQVQALIEAHRRKVGIIGRDISDEQIVDRCILALVNEGARLLDEGIAQRASDIDVIHVLGYGFPAGKGGPMFYAEHVARLSGVLEQIRRFAANPNAEPKFWSPAKALLKAAQLGRWPSAGAG
nr:3-hydroxyacyl-CoA dehydrogenase family protein [Burkholderiaceae bacterium]